MDSLFPYKIAGLGAGSVVIGVGSGLAAWWLEEAIDNQIRQMPWLLPVLVGTAAMGVSFWFLAK